MYLWHKQDNDVIWLWEMYMLCLSIGKSRERYTKLLYPGGVIMDAFIFLHTFFLVSKFSVMSKCFFYNLKIF